MIKTDAPSECPICYKLVESNDLRISIIFAKNSILISYNFCCLEHLQRFLDMSDLRMFSKQ